jgi:hypothetical protein
MGWGATYAITASKGKVTRTGTCVVASANASCSIKIPPGSWAVAITPIRGGVKGSPYRKAVKVKIKAK